MDAIALDLTPEEHFLYALARNWRTPQLPADAESLDWARIVSAARHNRMQTMLQQWLLALDMERLLPDDARQALWADAERLRRNAVMMGDALARYLHLAHTRGVQSVVLKGLDLSINVYGHPAMRPGADIDILVRRSQVHDSIAALEEMGLGMFWPNLMADAYVERHHLHLQRCTPDLKLWFEVHWALDHPYSLLTVDYEGMIDRATPGQLLGAPVAELSLADRLLALTIHLVKHAVYLPSILEHPQLARIVLADGMLVYYLDVAELITQNTEEMDWPLTLTLAREWGVREALGATLTVCRNFLAAPIPERVLAALPVTGASGVTRLVHEKMAGYELATYTDGERNRLWDFLVITNGAFILRPIRFLDAAAYIAPDRDFLERRYGDASSATARFHAGLALWQYGRAGLDTAYYMWDRYRRLRALNQSASIFNRLDGEG